MHACIYETSHILKRKNVISNPMTRYLVAYVWMVSNHMPLAFHLAKCSSHYLLRSIYLHFQWFPYIIVCQILLTKMSLIFVKATFFFRNCSSSMNWFFSPSIISMLLSFQMNLQLISPHSSPNPMIVEDLSYSQALVDA